MYVHRRCDGRGQLTRMDPQGLHGMLRHRPAPSERIRDPFYQDWVRGIPTIQRRPRRTSQTARRVDVKEGSAALPTAIPRVEVKHPRWYLGLYVNILTHTI